MPLETSVRANMETEKARPLWAGLIGGPGA